MNMIKPDIRDVAVHGDPLPAPFNGPVEREMRVPSIVRSLADGQVRALLDSSAAFHRLTPAERDEMRRNLSKISAYTAGLILEDWRLSDVLGQKPVVVQRKVVEGRREPVELVDRGEIGTDVPAVARAQADGFVSGGERLTPVAASSVARITEDTLNAIAFPTFVADLIRGTFQAIVDASIQQMEAFGELLANVAKTVDQFMADNITDNNARDWLADAYPQVVRIDTSEGQPRARAADTASEAPTESLRNDLNLPPDVAVDDDEAVEQTLVPAARRRLAQSRQQTLATMVLMGIQRIVVTRGRIKASMGFRIDTTDTSRSEAASKFDTKTEAQTSYGWFLSPVKASVKTSVSYVSSSKKTSESEIDVSADLTGEVDLQFRSDVFPLERFADAGVISGIQENTPNPGANKPITGGGGSK